jgi:hypothetical protein
MYKKIVILFLFLNVSWYGYAQIRTMPDGLRIGGPIAIIHHLLRFKDTTRIQRISGPLKVFEYDTSKFHSLLSKNDVLKISVLVDMSDTIRVIQLVFGIHDKNYFDSFRRYLPQEKSSLERYGTKSMDGTEQIFENLIRYNNFYISTALDGAGNIITEYDFIHTAILTIGFKNFIAVRKL